MVVSQVLSKKPEKNGQRLWKFIIYSNWQASAGAGLGAKGVLLKF